MTSSNISRVHQYLKAVASLGAPETVADFFAPDVIFQEFPNRIAPQGCVSRFADLHAAYERAEKSFSRNAMTYRGLLKPATR